MLNDDISVIFLRGYFLPGGGGGAGLSATDSSKRACKPSQAAGIDSWAHKRLQIRALSATSSAGILEQDMGLGTE